MLYIEIKTFLYHRSPYVKSSRSRKIARPLMNSGKIWYMEFSREFPACRNIYAFFTSRSLGIASSLCACSFRNIIALQLYSSVPINHLAHGPTIRLLERERAIILPDPGDARPPGLDRRWTLSVRRVLVKIS